ncbi:MAG TPA: SAF domain-containing protein [Sulfuricurvum sp.]|nr:SAF domain-containing protein [Sulfuricurvum sp.]
MNKKRMVLLSIGVLSLVIFGVIVMVMLYIKNNNEDAPVEKNIAAYVAAKNIQAGQKIALSDVELRSLPESYVGKEALSMAEIVDHYARVSITKSDLIRSEKLTATMVSPQSPIIDENRSGEGNTTQEMMVHDRISLPLNVFKNPDTTLHTGDRIDIVGIAEYGEEKRQFATRYIALHVAVGGFMKDGRKVAEIASVSVDEKTHVATRVFADEILLDMAPQEISRFLSLYYRSQGLNNDHAHNPNNLNQGHIWMVKCNSVLSESEQTAKVKMMHANSTVRPKVQASRPLPPLPKLVSAPRGIVSYEQ